MRFDLSAVEEFKDAFDNSDFGNDEDIANLRTLKKKVLEQVANTDFSVEMKIKDARIDALIARVEELELLLEEPKNDAVTTV